MAEGLAAGPAAEPDLIRIGGLPLVTLRAGAAEALVAPGRAMMLLAWRMEGRDVIWAPPLEEAAARLSGDFAGSASYAFGGAILAPWGNRIRGRPGPERTVAADVAGRSVHLPANDGPDVALHGLILDRAADAWVSGPDRVRGRIDAGDFGGRWPSRTVLDIGWTLTETALALDIVGTNEGTEMLPIGIGWHPYFALPSGDRDQAVLTLPAATRARVEDYRSVLPTGELVAVAGTAHDFRAGAALGRLYLDDCFTDLAPGAPVAALRDPAAGFALRIDSDAPPVSAVQVYAPPTRPFVVIEPQMNLADPFGAQWRRPTGMAMLPPGASVRYRAAVTAQFASPA